VAERKSRTGRRHRAEARAKIDRRAGGFITPGTTRCGNSGAAAITGRDRTHSAYTINSSSSRGNGPSRDARHTTTRTCGRRFARASAPATEGCRQRAAQDL
jgi:hypothetical protein